SRNDQEARSAWPRYLSALLAPVVAAIAAYLTFATVTFGNPLVMVSSQASVRGPLAAPWQAFVDFWNAGPHLHGFGNSILDAGLALVAVAALPLIFSKMRASYALYAALVVLISLSGSIISFNRL